MLLRSRGSKAFMNDLRDLVNENPDSVSGAEWNDSGAVLKLASGHDLKVWRSEDGVFFDMAVGSAASMGAPYGLKPKQVYRGLGFITLSSFGMRDGDEIFYASAIPEGKYSRARLSGVFRRFVMESEDFQGIIDEWTFRQTGGGPE